MVGLALLAAAPAAAADTVTPVARNEVATCVRDAGGGQLQLQAPITRTSTPTDLFTASPEQVERAAGTDLGNLLSCPEVASGGGVAVVAGFARAGDSFEVNAAARSNLDAFQDPVKLDSLPSGFPDGSPAVAVGPRGDAVVAWTESRHETPDDEGSVRMLAARRPAGPGARFGPVEEVVPWTDQRFGEYGTNDVAVGVDGDGHVTIAWALGVRPQRRVSHLSAIGVSTAGPGQPLRRTALQAGRQDVGRLALTVAPDGAALLATTYEERVHVFERPAGGAFAEGEPLGGEEQAADEAAVAVDPAGGAVVAWSYTTYGDEQGRARTGVQASRRAPGGRFGAPAVIWSRAVRGGSSTIVGLADEVSAPLDQAQLRAAIGGDGGTAITWVAARRVDGDRVPAGFVATAGPRETFSIARLGSPCRPVDNVVTFHSPGPRLAAAWTDNATALLGENVELPLKSGRLHVSDPRAVRAAMASTAPAITVPRVRGLQRLWSDDSIQVPVECAGPCDLRAFVPDGGSPAMASAASLAGRGRTRLPLYRGYPPLSLHPQTLRVVVHGCSPDGTSRSTASTTVRVVRNRPPKIPEPVDVRARRSGDEILVSWRTPFPARRTGFGVYGHIRRGDEAPSATGLASVEGKGRTRFHARLRTRPGRRARYVSVEAYSTEYSRQQHRATVLVSP